MPVRRLHLSLDLDGESRGRQVREVVEQLVRLPWVRGSLIVAPDGFVIAAHLPATVAVDALAALAATLGRELELGAARLGHGAFRTALFSADDGALLLGTTRVGFLVIVADPLANLHALRGALHDAMRFVEEMWAPPVAAAGA
ncbi:MAG TPA: roadblock/LC7 domain-containing protein [Methylomirabilota bacterium]|nr:roadblock/LC7 domain-containing protein [Methylomirabilota bacterium]